MLVHGHKDVNRHERVIRECETALKIKNKKDKLFPMMAGLCSLSLVIMIFALTREQEPVSARFTPPPFDSNAITGVPEKLAELGWIELDAKAFRFGVCGIITITEDEADIWLTNPESNSVWLKARILDENGSVLGETGLIKPGEYVQAVRFDIIPENGADIGLKVMAYQPDTYFSEGSAILNTTVKVEE